jgi:putative PIN family toxin of toxin-antitoxin system
MAAALERSLLFSAWLNRRFEMVMSETLFAEFQQVCARPHARRFLRVIYLRRFVAVLRDRAMWIKPAVDISIPRCRDPKDDIVIATAIAAHADFIVTNDGDLHDPPLVARLRDEYSICVVWPGEFLEAIRN